MKLGKVFDDGDKGKVKELFWYGTSMIEILFPPPVFLTVLAFKLGFYKFAKMTKLKKLETFAENISKTYVELARLMDKMLDKI